jgi:hypothetical protein
MSILSLQVLTFPHSSMRLVESRSNPVPDTVVRCPACVAPAVQYATPKELSSPRILPDHREVEQTWPDRIVPLTSAETREYELTHAGYAGPAIEFYGC